MKCSNARSDAVVQKPSNQGARASEHLERFVPSIRRGPCSLFHPRPPTLSWARLHGSINAGSWLRIDARASHRLSVALREERRDAGPRGRGSLRGARKTVPQGGDDSARKPRSRRTAALSPLFVTALARSSVRRRGTLLRDRAPAAGTASGAREHFEAGLPYDAVPLAAVVDTDDA